MIIQFKGIITTINDYNNSKDGISLEWLKEDGFTKRISRKSNSQRRDQRTT